MKVKYRITQEVGPTQTTYELQVRYLEQVSEWQTIASSGNQSTIQAQYNNLVEAAAAPPPGWRRQALEHRPLPRAAPEFLGVDIETVESAHGFKPALSSLLHEIRICRRGGDWQPHHRGN